MTNLIQLKDRKIFKIFGSDRKKFLQGLVTNDVFKASDKNLVYCAMLNNQGRFLYDFFIFEKDKNLYVDCFADRIDEITKKLNFYKLKSDVKIEKCENLSVFSSLNSEEENCFSDPRNKEMGYRIYQESTENFEENQDIYHQKRINLKIAESEHDLTYEKSIIAEFGFDEINAVDYEKGCYVGQELTARTHHLGQVRKKIFLLQSKNSEFIEKNCKIYCEEKKIGLILSSVKNDNKINYLALLRVGEDKNFEFKDSKLTTEDSLNELKFIK